MTQGPWRTRPTSSVSATPTASTEGFAGAAFGGNRREYLWLGRQCLCPLEPSQELSLHGLLGETRAFHHLRSPFLPLPLVGSGSWCWERPVETNGVGPGLVPSLPSSLPSLVKKVCEITTKESSFKILTFSSVLKTLRSPILRRVSCCG